MIAPSGWFAARPSGTEDVYKLYAESFQGSDHLRRIQDEAQAVIRTPSTRARPRTLPDDRAGPFVIVVVVWLPQAFGVLGSLQNIRIR